MGRVINPNSPGKRRGHLMRTIAEIIRRLGQHQGDIDDDVRDMVAMTIFCLREIDDGIIETIQAWEKRGYWTKADKFQQEWMWTGNMAAKIEKMLRAENWDELPDIMMKLFPHFSNIVINKMTRNPSDWEGCYDKLMED
ncbi:MAG: hypothetical protein Q9P44_10440 [Anaerolineae bacterium]|nr:hypothetical protein [Anaerolineae bacterium]